MKKKNFRAWGYEYMVVQPSYMKQGYELFLGYHEARTEHTRMKREDQFCVHFNVHEDSIFNSALVQRQWRYPSFCRILRDEFQIVIAGSELTITVTVPDYKFDGVEICAYPYPPHDTAMKRLFDDAMKED